MSLYSKDKCSKEELAEFTKAVIEYLTDNGIDISKIKMRCQRNYDGNIKIITHQSEFPNKRRSIRKDENSPTGYSRSTYSQTITMGIYFYRAEWKEYIGDENKDVREWNLKDIKKIYQNEL